MGDEKSGGAFLYLHRAERLSAPILIGAQADTVYSIAVADLDNDGDADIVLGNQDTPGTILLNNGKGTGFALLRFGDTQSAVYGLAIGDMNGDGSPDIVAARSGAPSMSYLHSKIAEAKSKPPVRR